MNNNIIIILLIIIIIDTSFSFIPYHNFINRYYTNIINNKNNKNNNIDNNKRIIYASNKYLNDNNDNNDNNDLIFSIPDDEEIPDEYKEWINEEIEQQNIEAKELKRKQKEIDQSDGLDIIEGLPKYMLDMLGIIIIITFINYYQLYTYILIT